MRESGAHRTVKRGLARVLVRCFLLGFVVGFLGPANAAAVDRQEELEGLREAIQGSRERVTAHEADERAFLEQLEDVDKRLLEVSSQRDRARREVAASRSRLERIEPELEAATRKLAKTREALAARAVALYRGGEVGPLRVLFSAESLQDMLSRASALRLLVRHDADLVARLGRERDALDALREEAARTIAEREAANARLTRLAAELADERSSKGAILVAVRKSRKAERAMLLELEQAAQALEETIRTLGRRADRDDAGDAGSGLGARRGRLRPPVDAQISERFGRVVDPDFKTTTFRSGVDFAAPAGTPVRCVAPGIVRFAGWFRGYGRIVIIDHGEDFHSISGHLDEIDVEVGANVHHSEVIGTVGETGSLGGPSLYFEIRRGGDPVDPEEWLSDGRG